LAPARVLPVEAPSTRLGVVCGNLAALDALFPVPGTPTIFVSGIGREDGEPRIDGGQVTLASSTTPRRFALDGAAWPD
jgi:hypothetical protein